MLRVRVLAAALLASEEVERWRHQPLVHGER